MKKIALLVTALLMAYVSTTLAQNQDMDISPPVVSSDEGDIPPTEDSQDEGEAGPALDNSEDEPAPTDNNDGS